ncbi:unnamed protein product [Didymodactylos carnosus]|uniref:NmrA-like family domain-containing protein 1 n=1 Tax=Didymodactylos carnosus TaxID=1234261 RepID=A0A815I3Y1_9BILA|nr:unnamed protein product [Didymodactylos carnosus]CAF4243012.1 unnamed protein product [Didymodactylos carnosus]
MSERPLVTVVGATGHQGGSAVLSLVDTGNSVKAQNLKRSCNNDGTDIELVNCDIINKDDLLHAFKNSWASYSVTDYWAQPNKPEIEMQQGKLMVDVAAELNIPYYISTCVVNINALSDNKLDVPHFTQKALIRDYIVEKYPQLKTIFVLPGCVQNWLKLQLEKMNDGTVVFRAPLDQKAKLHLVDIDDTGPIVVEMLKNPDQYIGPDICICGEEIAFEDVPKVFQKVTGIKPN